MPNFYLQKQKEMLNAGVTGPEGHRQSRPEDVGIGDVIVIIYPSVLE